LILLVLVWVIPYINQIFRNLRHVLGDLCSARSKNIINQWKYFFFQIGFLWRSFDSLGLYLSERRVEICLIYYLILIQFLRRLIHFFENINEFIIISYFIHFTPLFAFLKIFIFHYFNSVKTVWSNKWDGFLMIIIYFFVFLFCLILFGLIVMHFLAQIFDNYFANLIN